MHAVAQNEYIQQASPGSFEVVFKTTDEVRLSGIQYLAKGRLKGNIVVAGATGVPQGFYRRFALYACERGFNVLTFDYRGIGKSKSGSLKKLDMSFLDWGRYDVAAAVDYMHDDRVPLFLVGHSYGGQSLGLLPNHHLLTAAYSFGSGAGWSGWMSKQEAAKVTLLWHVILPVIVKWNGYMAWSKLGMGEDLPKGVYEDWKRWCRNPAYFFDDEHFQYLKDVYARIAIPYVAATSTDDEWAPPRSRDSFCQHYVNCDLILKNIAHQKGRTIGHMGYFRESCSDLWDDLLHWFRDVTEQSANKHHTDKQQLN